VQPAAIRNNDAFSASMKVIGFSYLDHRATQDKRESKSFPFSNATNNGPAKSR
jgi:hypothetical protein